MQEKYERQERSAVERVRELVAKRGKMCELAGGWNCGFPIQRAIELDFECLIQGSLETREKLLIELRE